MNGFDRDTTRCEAAIVCIPENVRAYGYVPHNEVTPYFEMAEQYAFADRMFQTNEGPSFPAHQYIVSGTSAITDGSALARCREPGVSETVRTEAAIRRRGTLVVLIDSAGRPKADSLSVLRSYFVNGTARWNESLSWRYYQAQPGAGLLERSRCRLQSSRERRSMLATW